MAQDQFWRSRTGRKEQKEGTGSYDQWEKDFDRSELGPRGLFKEYLEMGKRQLILSHRDKLLEAASSRHMIDFFCSPSRGPKPWA